MVNKKGVLMVIRDHFGKNKSNVFIFKVIIKNYYAQKKTQMRRNSNIT